MPKNIKVDLIIEAAHFKPNGYIENVRAYVRRGPTYSDCVLLSRAELINNIRMGKRVATGQRVPRMASTFIDLIPISVIKKAEHIFITSNDFTNERDYLNNIPTL